MSCVYLQVTKHIDKRRNIKTTKLLILTIVMSLNTVFAQEKQVLN